MATGTGDTVRDAGASGGITCPVCGGCFEKHVFYRRRRVPAVNNVTYATAEEALSSPAGHIELVRCPRCGLVFNSAFNAALVRYDEAYNNARDASGVYGRHIENVVRFCRGFASSRDRVLEIGCGNGDFLRCLSDTLGCRGDGYDTAYRGENEYQKRVRFHREYYRPENGSRRWDLLVVRHVIEHIPEPYAFLSLLSGDAAMKDGARLYVEVPDSEWIFENGSFFDITYEHCNYFCETSLAHLLHRTGWLIDSVRKMFGGQFLAVSAVYEGMAAPAREGYPRKPAKGITADFSRSRKRLVEMLGRPGATAVWGASGKGTILLGDLGERELEMIDFVIDIDPGKQGRFLPLSAKRVDSPEVLCGIGHLSTLVMNPVYRQEISRQLRDMGVAASITVAR